MKLLVGRNDAKPCHINAEPPVGFSPTNHPQDKRSELNPDNLHDRAATSLLANSRDGLSTLDSLDSLYHIFILRKTP